MRKLLLFAFCLSCLPLLAQNTRKSYTFCFDNPETLNPSITRSSYAGGAVSVTDRVFSTDDGHVTISFVKGSSPIGAEIITDNDDGGRIPYLTFNTGVCMIVSVPDPESAQLVEFKTPSYDAIGGVYLQDITPKGGPADFKRDSSPDSDGIRYYRWQGNAESLTFYNGGQSPTFHQLTVTYVAEALDLFKISGVSPAVGNVNSLDNVLLTFPSEVGRVDASKQIKLTDLSGNIITCQATKEGSNSVKITFNSTIDNGIYSLTIPEGTIIDAAGKYYNPTTTYFYNVGNYEPDIACTVSPTDGTVVDQLNLVTLTFTPPAGCSVSVANSSLITLSGAGQEIKPTSVTLTSANTFDIRFAGVTDGTYTLNIGKGAFVYSLSFNGNAITGDVKELSYNFTLNQNDKFQTDLMSKYLVYDRDGKAADEAMKDTLLNHFAFYSYETELGCDPTKTVELIHYNTSRIVRSGHFVATTDPNLPGAYVAEIKWDTPINYGSIPTGQYVITIPEATIGDKNFKDYLAGKSVAKNDCHVNYKTSVYKTANNSYVPTPDPQKPSDAVMAKARAALAKSGIGYPVANAQTRTVLQNLVNGGTGTDEEFNKAIQAYYAETNIQLPTQGKWYKIFAVSAENSIAYVQTTGTLTSSKSEAGAFKVGTSGNTLTFSTIDGQYLTVLTKDGSFTNSYAAAENNLAVARFPVTVGNVESTFGKMIISGTKNGSAMVSQVNAKTMTITTSGNTAVYNNDVTSAFQFEETDEPQAEPTPEIEYALSPESGQQISETGAEVTLTFKNENISNVIVADQNKIKLKKDAEVKSVTVSKQDDKVFVIKFGDLAPGTYTLLIEQGAFTFTFKNRVETVPEIKATYTVPEKAVPSQEMVDKVKAQLALTGIGYPKADSPARVALEELLKKNEGSDEVFQAALDAYYAEDDIELPVVGKYYRLKISNSSNIKYVALKSAAEDNTLALENAADNAAPFELKANADGTVTLVTVNDKYLTLPQPGACLSLTYDKAKHDLKLSRLSVADVSAEQTFGLMSVSLGGKYAVIGVFGLASYKDPADVPAYDKVKTSAFTFEEVDVSGIEMPDLTYSVTPETNAKVDVLDKFTITFLTSKKVTLADAGKIMLVSGYNGTKLYDVKSVKEVAGAKPNTFVIEFSKVKSGVYDLIIDEGAFKVSFLGRSESVQKIEVKGIFAQKDNEKDDDVIVGDVNGDGAVDVADISAIINVMAGMANWPDADVNGDGTVDVADISRVIIIMANGQD